MFKEQIKRLETALDVIITLEELILRWGFHPRARASLYNSPESSFQEHEVVGGQYKGCRGNEVLHKGTWGLHLSCFIDDVMSGLTETRGGSMPAPGGGVHGVTLIILVHTP